MNTSQDGPSDKPYKDLQILHNAQLGVRIPNRTLIHAVDQYLKYLRNETTKVCSTPNKIIDSNFMGPLSKTTRTSVEDMWVVFLNLNCVQWTFFSRITFEFVEKVRKSFDEADIDNTGYLDINEFTAFMRQTYPDITNREAQIVFMKV